MLFEEIESSVLVDSDEYDLLFFLFFSLVFSEIIDVCINI